MSIPFFTNGRTDLIRSITEGSKPQMRDSLLVTTDVEGVITAIKESGSLKVPAAKIGINISSIYSNAALPVKISMMLSEGATIGQFRKMVGEESGLISVHELVNGRLTYEAPIRVNDHPHMVQIVEKALRDEDGCLCGFSLVMTDISQEIEHGGIARGFPDSGTSAEDILKLTDAAELFTNAEGFVTGIRPIPNKFGWGSDLVGKRISTVFANQSLPEKIDEMLSRGASIADFEALLSNEWGILSIRDFDGQKLGYDAVLKFDSKVWVVRLLEQVVSEKGKIVGYYYLVVDTTDEYSLRHELALSERRFQAVIKHMNDVVYFRDGTGNVTYLSPSVEKVLGYKPEKLLKHLEDWPVLWPEGTSWEKANRLLCKAVTGDGTKKEFELTEYVIFDEAGRAIGFEGTIHDNSSIRSP